MAKLLVTIKKKLSTIKKPPRTRLENVHCVTPSIIANPEEQALMVKVLPLPSSPLVQSVALQLLMAELQ